MTDIFDLSDRIEALERAVAEMVVRGVISEADPARGQYGMVRVTYGSVDKPMITAWLPVKPIRAGKAVVWWFPEVGEGVTVISPGDLRMGEVFPGSFHAKRPAPSNDPNVFLVLFGDGSSVEHNREQHTLKIVNVGDIDVTTPEQIKMTASKGFVMIGNIEHQGDTHTTGNIAADKDISDKTRSMSADRGIYNGHDHPHGDPITSKPNQKQ
jgi:phage baseplate assembly protein V